MEEEELIPVIIDLQVLESHYHRKFQRPNAYKVALDSASYFIFEKHGITQEVFESNYTYYSFDVDEMYRIYETVLDSINLRVSEPEPEQ
ncbi:MAG: DUF4296 domain-containing protein [Crocinitomicaceae bacterium]